MIGIDPVALSADLIRCPSVTPAEAGALSLLETLLGAHGFACTRIKRGGIDNLFARWALVKMEKASLLTAIRMLCRLAIFRNGKVILSAAI